MQIEKTLEPYDEQSLAICWDPSEDAVYTKLLPSSPEFILNIQDENEEILSSRMVFRNRALISRALKEVFHPGDKIVVSNCPRKGGEPDGLLYLWSPDRSLQNAEDNADHFYQLLHEADFAKCSPEQLKLLFYLMNENKDLMRRNGEIMLEMERLRNFRGEPFEMLAESSKAQQLFPDRKVFRAWIVEKFGEFEPDACLLERNFPKKGIHNDRKVHVDFLFQDSTQNYLLVEIGWYSRGWTEDPMTLIHRLKLARDVVCRDMAASPEKVRRMIITNSLLHGMRDACTINNVELLHVAGFYRIQKHIQE